MAAPRARACCSPGKWPWQGGARTINEAPPPSQPVRETRRPCCSLPDAGELQGAALTRMALQTLAQFTFVPHTLLDFIRDHVIPCLDNPDPSIRKAAVVAACHGIEDHVTFRRRNGRRLHSSELRIVDKVRRVWCRQWSQTRRDLVNGARCIF